MTIALDFGTTNTVITRINPVTKASEIVTLRDFAFQGEEMPPVIPSLVYVMEGETEEILIGQQVRDKGLDFSKDSRFFKNFKRGIGAEIQGFLPIIDNKSISFEQIGEWFLGEILNKLENIDSLILTVPVDSFENYRRWLTDVCSKWDIDKIRLIDEPTAAALGYGVENDDYVLVVDFGGGTLDFSLVELNSDGKKQNQGFILKWGDKLFGQDSSQKAKIAKVVAKAGMNLGGCDIDNWILDYFHRQQGIVKSSLTNRLAEKLKIRLSQEMEAQETFFDETTLKIHNLSLDRATFEQILEENQFFQQLDSLMKNVLQQAKANGVYSGYIESAILVGGSGQIPSVNKWLQKYFPPEKIKCDRPFDAIALGALKLEQNLQIKDFLYHGYGVRYWNRRQNRHDWHTIIPCGQPYPMEEPKELILGASVDNQPSIELIIGELGQENTTTEVYFDGETLITRNTQSATTSVKPLNDSEGGKTIAQLNPLGKPGCDRIRVLFAVDENRYLKITVEDLLTDETLLDNVMVAELS